MTEAQRMAIRKMVEEIDAMTIVPHVRKAMRAMFTLGYKLAITQAATATTELADAIDTEVAT